MGPSLQLDLEISFAKMTVPSKENQPTVNQDFQNSIAQKIEPTMEILYMNSKEDDKQGCDPKQNGDGSGVCRARAMAEDVVARSRDLISGL